MANSAVPYQTKMCLKAPIITAADDNFVYLFIYLFFFFSEKTSLDISCESSAWQMIHMKCLDLFSLKNNKKKKFECRLLQILLGAFRVKTCEICRLRQKHPYCQVVMLNAGLRSLA